MYQHFDSDSDRLNVLKTLKHPTSAREVGAMHVGELAGDFAGGVSIRDEIAKLLEARSSGGWRCGWVQMSNYSYIMIDAPHADCARCVAEKSRLDELREESEQNA